MFADVGSEGLVLIRLDQDDLGLSVSVRGKGSTLTCQMIHACVLQALASRNGITVAGGEAGSQKTVESQCFEFSTGKQGDFKTETHLLWPMELICSSPGQDSKRSPRRL